MAAKVSDKITARGFALDLSPEAFGELRRSGDAIDDSVQLRTRLIADGYLYLPGYLDRSEVLAARGEVLHAIAEAGGLAPGIDPDDAVPGPKADAQMWAGIARQCPRLMDLVYGGRMTELYRGLFGEAVRHFDYTWLRAIAPGLATPPHMDSVFMNRGTLKLLTSWTPLGDIDRVLGGLAVLEGSHRVEQITSGYGMRDVDAYCDDQEGAEELAEQEDFLWDGSLATDPVKLREQLSLRWLTADYHAGDLVVFTIFTAHMGLDNRSDRFRLSCDSRYQPASEPADSRWIGMNPSAHGAGSKRAMIC